MLKKRAIAGIVLVAIGAVPLALGALGIATVAANPAVEMPYPPDPHDSYWVVDPVPVFLTFLAIGIIMVSGGALLLAPSGRK